MTTLPYQIPDPYIQANFGAFALAGGAGLIGTTDGVTLQAKLGSFSTRSALAALTPSNGSWAYLNEGSRRGWFVFNSANLSTQVSADTLQGIYVAPSSNTTGASGAWVRDWDGVHGRPEWFGATTGAGDSLAALQACVLNCPSTLLTTGDYYVSSTWKVQTQYRTIAGGVFSDGYGSSGTRILCTNAGVDVMQVGPDASPGSTSTFYRNINVKNLDVSHSVGLTGPATSSTAVCGLRAKYLLDCCFEHVYAWEELIGIWAYGCVGTFFRRCKGFRSAAQSGTDFFTAFWQRGIAPGGETIPANGGNASIYWEDCAVELGGSLSITKIGLYIDGDAADTFVDRLETSSATNGIVVALTPTKTYGAQDIHFRTCVFDQCSGNALKITGLNGAATITVSGGYYQANVATTTAIVELNGGAGSVVLTGGMQIIGGANGNLRGVEVNNQPNCTIDESVQITDCGYGIAALTGSDGLRVTCTIKNPNVGTGTQAGVYLGGITRGHIAPRITGLANGYAQGIYCAGTTNDKLVIDPTRVDPAAISGSNKLVINATTITTPGSYTSSGGAGTSGSGIYVTGITT